MSLELTISISIGGVHAAARPTLIKTLPLPLRRVIGDLSNTEKVLLGLEVQSKRTSHGNHGAEQ